MAVRTSVKTDDVCVFAAECHSEIHSLLQSVNMSYISIFCVELYIDIMCVLYFDTLCVSCTSISCMSYNISIHCALYTDD
jgi:hypothetical protein